MTAPLIDPTDEVTRTLAAAVHLDDEFADQLVEEYLSEPKRAIPPSPGVRAAAVLAEAAAAQAGRRLTSGLVLMFLVAFTIVSPELALTWLASALAWRVSSMIVDWFSRSRDGQIVRLSKAWRRWWVTAVLWNFFDAVLVLGVWLIVLGWHGLQNSSSGDGDGYGAQPSARFSAGPFILVALLVVAIFVTLVTYAILRVVTAGAVSVGAPSYPPRSPRRVLSWACGPYSQRLQRISEDDARRMQASVSSEVVVYRGHNPFVGAGTRVQTLSLALELHAADGAAQDDGVPLFSPAELHDFVSAAMQSLRTAPTLSPGFRFNGLEIVHWAALSARHLLRYQEASSLLEQVMSGSNPTLLEQDWPTLIDISPEWLRYFRAYRLEGWERQLGVAGFLGIGCDPRTLYLEWHEYVLPPVAQRHRIPDEPAGLPEIRAVWRGIGDFVLLPVTVPARVTDLVRALRRGRGGRWRTPEQMSRILGAESSLRELAAGEEFTTFFESADSDRYLKIMERRLFDAIHRFLLSKGISTSAFDSIVTQIDNSTVLNNCSVIAGNVGGHNNAGTVGPGPQQ